MDPVRQPLAASIADLAARQHGVVARRQLLAVGITAEQVQGLARRAHLHRLHRGVYAVGHRALTQEGRWLAAVLACAPGAALSHGPAGQLLGIVPRREQFAIHVSVPGRGQRGPAGVVCHFPRCLSDRDITTRNRIPVTTPTRTVWDLATILTPLQVRRAFEQAEKLRALDRERLRSLLDASPSRQGAGVVRELLAERILPLEATRSRLEEVVLETCRDHGLPLPAVDVPLLGFEVDFLWPDARLVVEADGGAHLDRAQRDRDNERDAALARAGYLVRRYSWRALADGAAVAAEIAAILAERTRAA
ncbi:MAG: type IV toxin-antitoxin system AbiEi family antitoxin domain-containing protein [Solirubrobacterales bacterium]